MPRSTQSGSADRKKQLSEAVTQDSLHDGITNLITQLNHHEKDVRVAAVEALAQIGQPAIPPLIEALKHDDPLTRSNAGNTLGKIAQSMPDSVPFMITAVPLLIELLHDVMLAFRGAAYALAHIGAPARDAIPSLIEALRDPEPQVSRDATWALGKIMAAARDAAPDAVPGVIAALISMLTHADKDVREDAAEALGTIGSPAVQPFITALETADTAMFARIAQTFPYFLWAFARSAPDSERWIAEATLNRFTRNHKAIALALLPLLDDPRTDVRGPTIWALGCTGSKPDPAVTQALVRQLHDPNSSIRAEAAETLKEIAPASDPALAAALRHLLYDPDGNVRERAIRALGRIAPSELDPQAAEQIVPVLVADLEQEEVPSTMHSKRALQELGPHAVRYLVPVLIDADQAAGSIIRDILTQLAQSNPAALSALTETVPLLSAAVQDGSKSYEVRCRVLAVLNAMKANARGSLPALKAIYEEDRREQAKRKRTADFKFLYELLTTIQSISPEDYSDLLTSPSSTPRIPPSLTKRVLAIDERILDSNLEKPDERPYHLRGLLDPPESKPKPKQGESKPEPLPPTEEKIEVSVTLPSDPRERLEAIVGAFVSLANQAAGPMKPAIADLLKEAQQLDFDGMASTCRLINRALNYSRRAILDPQTNLPALVQPNRPRPSSEVSYVQLRDTRHAEDGRRHMARIQDGADQLKRRHPPANPLPRISSDQIELVSIDQETEPAASVQPSAGRGR